MLFFQQALGLLKADDKAVTWRPLAHGMCCGLDLLLFACRTISAVHQLFSQLTQSEPSCSGDPHLDCCSACPALYVVWVCHIQAQSAQHVRSLPSAGWHGPATWRQIGAFDRLFRSPGCVGTASAMCTGTRRLVVHDCWQELAFIRTPWCTRTYAILQACP
jgi:hypothetical protein